MNHFDVCVIGAGMIGSAAAKYCCVYSNQKIILIGPEEPNKEDYANREIFGAYYDEGRIVRSLYSDPLWAYLAISSVQRYRQIEKESGVNFYTENGFLTILDESDLNIEKICQTAKTNGVKYEKMSDTMTIRKKFPYLNPLKNSVGLYEAFNAGSINPRLLVKAQHILAQKLGVTVISDIVINIDHSQPKFRISTKKNGNFTSEKIILCVGAYLFHYNLLPKGKENIEVKCGLISTARIPVSKSFIEKLSNMPSITLTTNRTYLSSEVSDKPEAFYMMPPVKYPDDKWYLKLGYHSHARKGLYGNPTEITDWYRNGQSKVVNTRKKLIEIAQRFIPDLSVNLDTAVSDTCAIMETPNDRPYIDEVAHNFYVVSGCNGFSAKSSDEFGRIVARLAVNNVWDCPIAALEFKIRYNVSKL